VPLCGVVRRSSSRFLLLVQSRLFSRLVCRRRCAFLEPEPEPEPNLGTVESSYPRRDFRCLTRRWWCLNNTVALCDRHKPPYPTAARPSHHTMCLSAQSRRLLGRPRLAPLILVLVIVFCWLLYGREEPISGSWGALGNSSEDPGGRSRATMLAMPEPGRLAWIGHGGEKLTEWQSGGNRFSGRRKSNLRMKNWRWRGMCAGYHCCVPLCTDTVGW